MRSMIFAMLGFVVYIAVLGVYSFRSTREMINIGVKAMQFEQKAYHDQLTGLNNRMAYADYTNRDEFSPQRCIIAVFDLNNLKKSLVIEIPKSVDLTKVKVDVSSSDVTCENFEAESVDVYSSSGDVTVECGAKKVKLHASSGDISLLQHGDSDEISIDVSSGKIDLMAEDVETLNVEANLKVIKAE